MPLYIMFQEPAGLGHAAAVGVGKVRASESVASGGTGALTAQDGEIAVLLNTESDALGVAHGLTPDATATTATDATSAVYQVPSGHYIAVKVATGDKFEVA